MKFDLKEHRTLTQRIAMVQHPDFLYEDLLIVAQHDTEDPVILACAFSKKADKQIEDIILDS